MSFFCIHCKAGIDPDYRACPHCGEPISDFLRKYTEALIDGKYQVLARLGVGGMGEVYKVLHVHLNSIRVIKMMRPDLSNDPDADHRFIREARLASKIVHPNVAALFDFSILDDRTQYMVWEYIEGENLSQWIRARGALEPLEVARLAVQALRGLEAVHRAGVVHRDISPENLMVTTGDDGTYRVKLIDLGIAKPREDAGEMKTKTGIFVGKWKYCSPEHLGMLPAGEEIDGRADIYSFGIVLYEMLTGVPPFVSDTPHGYLQMHARQQARPLIERKPRLSAVPELEALVFRALAKDRNDRFPTAARFADELEALIPSLESLRQEAAPSEPAAPTRVGQDRPISGGGSSRAQTEITPQADDTLSEVTLEDDELSRRTTWVGTPVPPPSATAPVPEWIETAELTRTFERPLDDVDFEPLVDEAPSQHRGAWIAAAVGSFLIVAVALFLALWWSPAETERVPEPIVADTTAASDASPVEDRDPAPAAGGAVRLGLNAFPWAEVLRVRDLERGTEVELPDSLITPAALELPPGRYEVMLRGSSDDVRRQTVELRAEEAFDLMIQFRQPDVSSPPSFREEAP